MKEFNIQKAREGYPVCTRDGRKTRILTFDRQCNTPIVALVDNSDEYDDPFEVVCSYHEDGKYELQGAHPNDLMMAPVKHEGYVNIYQFTAGHYSTGQSVYKNEEDAVHSGKGVAAYIATAKIEWEE